jgi:hypothetical protein
MKTIVPASAFLDEQKQTAAVTVNITGMDVKTPEVVDGEIVKEDLSEM